MNTIISLSTLHQLLIDAATAGAKKALTDAGLVKATMSKNAAYKKYGQGRVDAWLQNKLIEAKRDQRGRHAFHLDVNKLDSLASADNRHKFIETTNY